MNQSSFKINSNITLDKIMNNYELLQSSLTVWPHWCVRLKLFLKIMIAKETLICRIWKCFVLGFSLSTILEKIHISTVAPRLSMFELKMYSFPSLMNFSSNPELYNAWYISPWPGGYQLQSTNTIKPQTNARM